MKRLSLIVITNIFIPILLLIILPSIFINTRSGVSNESGNKQISLTNTNSISFSITTDQPYLKQIILDLKNPGIKNNSLITIDITSQNSLLTQTLVFYGSNIGDPSQLVLKFPYFNEPAHTTYNVKLTTDNQNHDQLYVIANDNSIPTFQTFYAQPKFADRITLNYNFQLTKLSQISQPYLYSYFLILIILNFLYYKNSE